MCGIAGICGQHQVTSEDKALMRRMNTILAHRGPDDEGVFEGDACVLGHRRLAIIDLSTDGHQPFASDDHKLQLVFNGEIYNYIELRGELENFGWVFKTKTDTEVLLKAYQQWGDACVERFNGMFAFAIYDSIRRSLFLARDRFGIKPLYYTIQGERLYFASEIKALRIIPSLTGIENTQAIFDYLVFDRTDIFDETFYRNIKRIPQGHWGVFAQGKLALTCWWRPHNYVGQAQRPTMKSMCAQIEDLFVSSVKLCLRSDVPVGSCLSGGLDSSVMTGVLYQHGHVGSAYKTFTAAFSGYAFDETAYVEELNQRYDFVNHRVNPQGAQLREQLQDFIQTNEEPVATTSAFAQYCVMKEAKAQGIVVMLDGQGGDESFVGYPYFYGFYLYGLLRRRVYGQFLTTLRDVWCYQKDNLIYKTLLFQLLPDSVRQRLLYARVPYMKKDFFEQHLKTSRIYQEFLAVNGLNASVAQHFQYKLEHLLRTEDRNSMAFSVEARVPYLDHRLVEYMLGLHEDVKVEQGQTKWLQKQALQQYSLSSICERKDKLGFTTPMADWMRQDPWQDLARASYRQMQKQYTWLLPASHERKFSAPLAWKSIQLAMRPGVGA